MRPMAMDTALIFFPRGGSAQVARYLLRELNTRGWTTRIHAGSLGDPGDPGHAATFYTGLDLHAYDYNPAYAAWQSGQNAQDLEDLPFHPSYEDRSLGKPGGCPDPMFAAVPPRAGMRLTAAWQRHLHRHLPTTPVDVLHLHHLSYLQTAALRIYPGIPTITTLHGTELKQLDGMLRRIELAHRLDTSVTALADNFTLTRPHRSDTADRLARQHKLAEEERELLQATDWQKWRYSEAWYHRLLHAADLAGRVVTVSEHDRDLAHRLVPSLAGQEVPVIPNGVDTNRFRPTWFTDEERMANLRHWLITDPKGWADGREPGSLRYREADLDRLWEPGTRRLRPILLWVGRFLDFKRVPVLLEAFAKARTQLDPAPVLIMWGGYPGECEGQHPSGIADRLGIGEDVYFAGWRDHSDLAAGLSTADLMVAPAVNEPFGMVYIEAMACGIPPIATATGGPARTITPGGDDGNGWLVQPDNVDDLAAAIIHAVTDDQERARRARNAAEHAHAVYGWETVADRYTEVYSAAIDHAR